MGSAPGGGWREAPPLPEPRWLHAGAAGPEGHVAVFGGYVLAGEKQLREYGRGEYGLRVRSPEDGSWGAAPPAPAYRLANRYPLLRTDAQGNVQRIARRGEIERPLLHELPPGAADPRGRVYWFALEGPVYFDLASGTWGQPPSPVRLQKEKRFEGSVPPYVRKAAATVTLPDGRILRAGGIGHPPGESRAEHQFQLLASVDVYDPATNSWSEAPPMREARQFHAAAVGPEGRVYVFGGCACTAVAMVESDDAGSLREALRNQLEARRSVAATEVFDPAEGAWSEAAPMPRPRQMLAAAAGADGRIYVIGGVPSVAESESVDTVDVFDPATGRWSDGPSLDVGRHGHVAVSARGGRIVVAGGFRRVPRKALLRLFRGEEGPLDSVEVLETAR